ncbi:MAG: glycosyltransferase family 39 protein [Isosphaeraceae bacterium]|nr:glycosyltransferase family 39 protein [Isosphaeraceae bacterium]
MRADDLLTGIASAILMILAGCLATLATRNHRSTRRLQLTLLLTAFAIRFFMSILLYQCGLNSQIVGTGDDSGWMLGVAIMSKWDSEGLGILDWPVALLGAFEGHHLGYGYLLAVYYSLTGLVSALSAAAIDCICGALTVVFAYRTARLLFSEWVATRVGWWVCFFPLMIIWSAQTIKEPIIIMLEGAALYGCLSIRAYGFSIRSIFLSILSVALLLTLRFYAAYITGAAVLVALALPQLKKKRLSWGAGLVVVALVLPVLTGTGASSRHADTFSEWDVQRVSKFRKDIAVGTGSGVESSFDMTTTRGLGLATLDGAIHLLLAPFPWEMRLGSLRMILTTPELIFWWILFVRGVIPGLMLAVRQRLGDVLPVLLFLFGLGVIYSLTFGNIGVVYRQRAQLMPYLLMFGAYGLEHRRMRHGAGKSPPVAALQEPNRQGASITAAVPVLPRPARHIEYTWPVSEADGRARTPGPKTSRSIIKSESPPGPPQAGPSSDFPRR